MPLIFSLSELPDDFSASVVSIGNFDGVHLGHQAVIRQLITKADNSTLPVVVVTFDPLAKEYFSAKYAPEQLDKLPERLSSVKQRAGLLESLGVDYVFCLNFDQKLEQQSAEDFIQQVLIDGLRVKHLVVGDDFHFGYQRQGNFALLKQLGAQNGFQVESMQTFSFAGERVSSGRVREALQLSDFPLVENLLGRPFSIKSQVQQGQQLGTKIGFPTANLDLSDFANSKLPLQGVFAVNIAIDGEQKNYQGVANIGVRPTVDGVSKSLEVHLFNFATDFRSDKARQSVQTEASYGLYGLELEVFFLHKIRDEMKFASIDDLQQQITIDVANARAFFN